MVVRVSLLGTCLDFDEVVDWPLHTVGLAFFRALDDEHSADNAAMSGNV